MSQEGNYLSNTKANVKLLGLTSLLNPCAANLSAQRGAMLSAHIPQAQIVHGCEHPLVFTGFESLVGEYEYNTTERNQDIQILKIIPRFIPNAGVYPIRDNPYYTIIFRGADDNKVGYFQYEKFTMRSDGFGYVNNRLNRHLLSEGNYVSKDVKLCTSPAHDGNKYMLGSNLNVAYMSLPQVTEDAFVISETAYRKMCSDHYGKTSFKILPNQIPINLYGDEEEYKFIPDIGEFVNDDGILTALRTPTADSIIGDMNSFNLTRVQALHDTVFHVPPRSQICDVNIWVNRKCKVKTPREIFAQVQKYRDPINAYYLKIMEAYHEVQKDGLEITPAFNTLVTNAISSLLADGVRIPGYSRKADVSLVKKKEPIEFLYVTVTYKTVNDMTRGKKFTGRCGNKGTNATVWKDEDMPVDQEGIRADVIVSPETVFNRMNPPQWYEQFFNRGAILITRRLKERFGNADPTAPGMEPAVAEAWELFISYNRDINPKWAELLEQYHPSIQEKAQLLQETFVMGTFPIQVTPFQEGIDTTLVKKMKEKYNITKSPVTFTIRDENGIGRTVTTRRPVLIGPEYWYLLYKMPHMRCVAIGYVNQYHSPVRANALAKQQHSFSMTPIRLGEDEHRNGNMTAGPDACAHLLGAYANSAPAVQQLADHLAFDECPSRLESIEMSSEEIIKTNSIIGVTKHIFSAAGVDISPDLPPVSEEEYARMIAEWSASPKKKKGKEVA